MFKQKLNSLIDWLVTHDIGCIRLSGEVCFTPKNFNLASRWNSSRWINKIFADIPDPSIDDELFDIVSSPWSTDYAVLLPWKHHAWKWQSVSQVGSEWVFYEKFARYWDSRTELHPNTECIKLQNNSTLSYIQKINYYFPGLTQNNYLDIH